MSNGLYFAYGSNLNLSDFDTWCRGHGYPTGLLKFRAKSMLPDHDLGFTYHSVARKGGVLDLVERRGQLVPGILFEMDAAEWAALDAKEGAPSIYRRVEVEVIDRRGEAVKATTYRVRPGLTEDYVAPTPAYLQVVRGGQASWGINSRLLRSAVDQQPSPRPDGFFFYGTLMRGEQRFDAVRRFGLSCTLLAAASGRLVDLGNFPGLIDVANGRDLVQGEFMRLRNPEKAIAALDAIEGFRGYGKSGSLFRRTWISVDVGDGRIRSVWAYALSDNTGEGEPIPSGDWREHRGTRGAFLSSLAAVHAQGDERRIAEQIAGNLPYSFAKDSERVIQDLLPLGDSLASGYVSERRLSQESRILVALP
jgi:gamma-glutamylcyclotransferase (GGCT)/AIG2-like uncharacterized protein YtfP